MIKDSATEKYSKRVGIMTGNVHTWSEHRLLRLILNSKTKKYNPHLTHVAKAVADPSY